MKICSLAFFCVLLLAMQPTSSFAMRRSGSEGEDIGNRSRQITSLITILGILGPFAREALRQVPTVFQDLLIDLRDPPPHGLGWTDRLELVGREAMMEPQIDVDEAQTVPVHAFGYIIEVNPESGMLIVVDPVQNNRMVRQVHLGNHVRQPVVIQNRIYVPGADGMFVVDPQFHVRRIELGGEPQNPVLHGRWLFVANAVDGTITVLDTTLAEFNHSPRVVRTIDVGGLLGQPVVVMDRLFVPSWVDDPDAVDGGAFIFDLGGFEDIEERVWEPTTEDLLKFFVLLNPLGRECLRQVPNPYQTLLTDFAAPSPRGFNWIDCLPQSMLSDDDEDRLVDAQPVKVIRADDVECVFRIGSFIFNLNPHACMLHIIDPNQQNRLLHAIPIAPGSQTPLLANGDLLIPCSAFSRRMLILIKLGGWSDC